jgi:glucose/arabinose dehydrogenase
LALSVALLAVTTSVMRPVEQPEVSTVPLGIVPSGFTDRVTLSGLTYPTSVAFSPDGRVFVAEKSGLVKAFDSMTDSTPTTVADLRTNVYDFIDRGLLGLAVDPQFPVRPFLYVVYTYDAEPGGVAPRWNDSCPTPPGATTEGCIAQGRLSKLVVNAAVTSSVEQPLITDWCQQFPSHSIGTVAVGPDGALYAGAGDGASYGWADYGQAGNACGDPPSPAGTDLTPPTADGGALRSQSMRRGGTAPVSLDGAIVRVDPDTGAGLPGNPFASSANVNARRIIAYGMRNPFRFTLRPGTDQLWLGDVGWNTHEEINRIADVNDAVAENFGWPCFEGVPRQPAYDAANLNRCESLYSGGGNTAPLFTYPKSGANVVPNDGCTPGQASVSGVAFEDGSNYPAAYDGALFFADATRRCIWVMRRNGGADPSPTQISPFVTQGGGIVQVLAGPGGDLYYLDIMAGALHRIVYNGANHPPNAVASANPATGAAPLAVTFSGAGSSDLDAGNTLSYAWDLDADGQHDDATGVTASRTFTANGTYTVGLRVRDNLGAEDTTTTSVVVGPPNAPPQPVIDTPTPPLGWAVGEPIAFSGRATDAEDGALAADRLTWSVVIHHCSGPGSCHVHPMQQFPGQASGSFPAPDHEYPMHVTLELTATDSAGRQASTSVELDPRTVDLTLATEPAGLQVAHGSTTGTAPLTRPVIVGSSNSVSAPGPQTVGGQVYAFESWSDGGAATHNAQAGSSSTTLTADYAPVTPGCPATPSGFNVIPPAPGVPAAAPLPDGRTVFGTLGIDRQFYIASQDVQGHPVQTGPLECYGGTGTDRPAIAAGNGYVALLERMADNRVFMRTLTPGDDGAWAALPIAGSTTNGPAAVVTADGVLHVVIRGTNGAVYHAKRTGSTWSAFENLGGAIIGSPAVAPLAGGGIAIFARATNNGVYARSGTTGAWLPWTQLPGETLAEPAVAWGYSPNRIDLFLGGTAGGLWQNAMVNGVWTGLTQRDPSLPAGARLAAVSTNLRMVVYATSAGATTTRQYLGSGSWLQAPTSYTCPTCAPGSSAIGPVR